MYFLLKMEIFHGYVSLPEGMLIFEGGTCYDPSIRLFRRPKHLDLSWDSFFARQVGCILRDQTCLLFLDKTRHLFVGFLYLPGNERIPSKITFEVLLSFSRLVGYVIVPLGAKHLKHKQTIHQSSFVPGL